MFPRYFVDWNVFSIFWNMKETCSWSLKIFYFPYNKIKNHLILKFKRHIPNQRSWFFSKVSLLRFLKFKIQNRGWFHVFCTFFTILLITQYQYFILLPSHKNHQNYLSFSKVIFIIWQSYTILQYHAVMVLKVFYVQYKYITLHNIFFYSRRKV